MHMLKRLAYFKTIDGLALGDDATGADVADGGGAGVCLSVSDFLVTKFVGTVITK